MKANIFVIHSIDIRMLYCIHLIFVLIFSLRTQYSTAAVQNTYTFTTENVWLSMPDGVRLSATLTIPIAKRDDETFPVLLEYKPYRKDDNFFNSDQSNIFYLVRRGFIVSNLLSWILCRFVYFLSGGQS
jgi:hypothetical protein